MKRGSSAVNMLSNSKMSEYVPRGGVLLGTFPKFFPVLILLPTLILNIEPFLCKSRELRYLEKKIGVLNTVF